MTWHPVEKIDDSAMRKYAQVRATIKLIDGRVARLVSWPGHQKRRGRYCRLETAAGTRFTVHCRFVESVEEPL
jgi:hypothetical protein